ncbi:Integral membrane protein [Neofusicoccum parvum]|nr:Integral membrane protein [Neofusicoccum parvum]
MPGGVVPPLELVLQWQTDAFPHGIRAPPTLTVIAVVFTALALATTLARLYDRVMVRHNAGVDDVLISIALVPQIGLCITTCLAEQLYGFDRHAWDITPEMAPLSRKITLSTSMLYLCSTSLTKISILGFYRRIGKIRPWFKWTIWANMAYIGAYTITFIIALPLECTPVNAYWNKVNPIWAFSHVNQYTCINEGAGNIAAGAISASQDLIACILPMAIFWDLRISKRAKVALGVVFSLGLFTCACGILRTFYLYRIFFQTYDTTWTSRWAFALTLVESSMGLICASIPALKSSLHRSFTAFISSTTAGSKSKRWKNPFFRSYRSSQAYVNWSSSDASRRTEGGPTTPHNTYNSRSSRFSQSHRKSAPPKSLSELELSPTAKHQSLEV